MSFTRKYRTRDGLEDYQFSFEETNNGYWRAYILDQPDYGAQSEDAHSTHRLTDEYNRKYVCWTEPFTCYQDAMRVAALWADATQRYIRTGCKF